MFKWYTVPDYNQYCSDKVLLFNLLKGDAILHYITCLFSNCVIFGSDRKNVVLL